MSHVHFLDVFDPAGLSAGLSDRDAAEQARSLGLAAPSPRLLALLTRIREQPPGVTVNVVGGRDQLPVQWIAGEPPRAEGEGAHCALWTLILPVDEDVQALAVAGPKIEAWVESLGLRMYDPQREAFERQEALDKAATQAIVQRRAEQKASAEATDVTHSDIMLIEPYGFFMNGVFGTFATFRQARAELSLREVCELWMKGRKLDHPYDIAPKRLITRLLQRFPFDGEGKGIWCGRHPLTEPVYQSDGVRVFRVSRGRLDEVLRQLLPLARGLFLTVAVPDLDLYVNRSRNPEAFAAHPMEKLAALDPDWQNHRLSKEKLVETLSKALGKVLMPLGFNLVEEKGPLRLICYERSLANGRVRHVVGYESTGLVAQARSQRYLETCEVPIGGKPELTRAVVAEMILNTARCRDDRDWLGLLGGGVDSSNEYCAMAVEDLERLILPQLNALRTAADLWAWHQRRPVAGDRFVPDSPGMMPPVGNWPAVRAWLKEGNGTPRHYHNPWHLSSSLYAARCLPDEQLLPMLDDWLASFNPEAEHLMPRARKLAEVLRAMPQTPMDAPL